MKKKMKKNAQCFAIIQNCCTFAPANERTPPLPGR